MLRLAARCVAMGAVVGVAIFTSNTHTEHPHTEHTEHTENTHTQV